LLRGTDFGNVFRCALAKTRALRGLDAIGWIIALIWSYTGNTAANFYRLEPGAAGATDRFRDGPAPYGSSSS